MNQFTERYKLVSNTKLLEIIEEPESHAQLYSQDVSFHSTKEIWPNYYSFKK